MKKYLFFIMFVLIELTQIAYAKDAFFENDNGVSFSKEEYNFISEMYYNGFQNIINKDDYEMIFSENVTSYQIEKKVLNNAFIQPNATFHKTNSKEISISKVCDDTCLIATVVDWTALPNVRSYDLIGAYLENVKLIYGPITYASNSENTITSSEIVTKTNGFGISIKIPEIANNLRLVQTFRVSKSGVVYASYQHAKKNISLSDSKKYDISLKGYGSVFLFNTLAIKEHYDGMSGVFIQV